MKISALALVLLPLAANAHDFSIGDLRIVHPFAVPSVPGTTTGAAYLALENTGRGGDRLLSATTARAKRVELHRMSIDDGVMRMREVEAIDLAAGSTLKMRPGEGFHLMLIDLARPLKEGETFPLTIRFEKAGAVEVKAYVQIPKAAASAHRH